MSSRHKDALAHLLYGVGSGGGFILLTGEVGTGKTTLNRCLLEHLPDTTDLAIVLNPALSASELLATVCDELGIEYPENTDSLKSLTDALHRFLLSNYQAGRRTVLMIDEAQHLDFDVLEQIRLLTNLETDDEKLLQIILIGQPELTEKLARSELRQLNQRITARYDLRPLTIDETEAYIRHRLTIAGLPPGQALFSPSAVRDIHRRTGGIPRQINLLCDRALLGAYGRQQTRITPGLIRSAAAEVFGRDEGSMSGRVRWWLGLGIVTTLLVAVVLVADIQWPWLTEPMSKPMSERMSGPSEQGPGTSANPLGGAGAPPAQTLDNAWLLEPEVAEQWFWQLSSDAPRPQDFCSEGGDGLQCVTGQDAVWNELIGLNRPVLLTMQTPDRFRAATLVVAFDARSAWVMTTAGPEQVPLRTLARHWQGRYQYLWRPPLGWQGPVLTGERSAVVAHIAGLFAELDQQDKPLADTVFNTVLQARVTLFQSTEGLTADGVVGERTMMRLQDRMAMGVSVDQRLQRARQIVGGL